MSEDKRIKALDDLQIWGTPREAEFDRLVRITAHLAHADYAHLCFINATDQFIKSSEGGVFSQIMPRAQALCDVPLRLQQRLYIEDLEASLKILAPQVQLNQFTSYVGVPIMADGYAVGILAALSTKVGELSTRRLTALDEIAELIRRELQLRKARLRMPVPEEAHSFTKVLESTKHLTKAHLNILNAINDGVLGFRSNGEICFVNPAAERLLGRPAGTLLEQSFAIAVRSTKAAGPGGGACPVAACLADRTERFVRADKFLRTGSETFDVEYAISPVTIESTAIGAFLVFRDTSGTTNSNGILLRESLREVTRLRDKIAKLEAQASSFLAHQHDGYPRLRQGSAKVPFSSLMEAIQVERDEQASRATALMRNLEGLEQIAAPSGSGEGGSSATSLASKDVSRVERWKAIS